MAGCPSGYVESGSTCVACTSPCSTCIGSTRTCSSCSLGLLLYDDTCYSSCPNGFVAIANDTCVSCTSPCATCTIDSTNCTSCTSGNFLLVEDATCYSTCPDGYYTSGSDCAACSPTCATCAGTASACTSCSDGLLQYGTTCAATCPNGTYASAGSSVCSSCTFPCGTCTGTASTCTGCILGQFLYEGTCYPTCPIGTTANGTSTCSLIPVICASTSVNDANFASSQPNTPVTGVCAPGFSGTASGFCRTDGTWDPSAFVVNCTFFTVTDGGRVHDLRVTYIDSNSVVLVWTVNVTADGKVAQYVVLQSTDGISFSSVFSTAPFRSPTATVTQLSQNTLYYFQVFAASSDLQHDTTGGQITATTTINPPGALVLSNISPDGFVVSWPAPVDSLATYYQLSLRIGAATTASANTTADSASSSSKAARSTTPPTVNNQTWTVLATVPANGDSTTSYNITGLLATTSYNVWVQSVLDLQHAPEPIGSSALVTTPAVPPVNTTTGPPIAAIAAAIAVIVVILIILICCVILYRRRVAKRQKQILADFGVQLDTMNSFNHLQASVIPDEVAIGGNTHYSSGSGGDVTKTHMSKHRNAGDATMINTVLEVALPGFLKLDYTQDMRPEDKLTAGGAGTIFRAQLLDNQLAMRNGERTVAVKHIPDHPTLSHEESMERFHQEVAIMWSLSFHPNVVKLIGYTDEPHTIVSPLYKSDLFRFLHGQDDDKTQLSSELMLHLCHGMMSGLDAIHSMGVAHRDIKSPNVLLAEPKAGSGGNMPIPVICDFGLSRTTDDGSAVKKSAVIHGLSPRYAAPEVFVRVQLRTSVSTVDDDKRADMYSMGVTFWETFCRRIPWNGISNDEVEMRIRSGQRLDHLYPNEKDDIQILLVTLIDNMLQASAARRTTAASGNLKLTEMVQLHASSPSNFSPPLHSNASRNSLANSLGSQGSWPEAPLTNLSSTSLTQTGGANRPAVYSRRPPPPSAAPPTYQLEAQARAQSRLSQNLAVLPDIGPVQDNTLVVGLSSSSAYSSTAAASTPSVLNPYAARSAASPRGNAPANAYSYGQAEPTIEYASYDNPLMELRTNFTSDYQNPMHQQHNNYNAGGSSASGGNGYY